MRVLFIHNYYQHRGGEDAVFEEEVNLLRENGLIVKTVEFNNKNFNESTVSTIKGAIKSIYNNESAIKIKQEIKSFKPDIVHIHNLFYTASPSVIYAAKQQGIPVIMTLHNYRLVCNSGMLSREAEVPCERCLTKTVPLTGIKYGCFRNSRLQSAQLTAITSLHKYAGTWQNVDRFIVLTDFAREKILKSSLKLKVEQVVVKPNYIQELGYVSTNERKNFFLYIGRLHYEKGIESLIKAAYLHNLPIEIIGDGPFKPLVEKAAKDLPHVQYRGFLPRENCIERMKQCKAVIIPSICYEGLPTAILEAFSTGTPVLCSNQGNLNSIIINNQTGILFETGNPFSIAEKMNALTDRQCEQFSAAGYNVYKEKYKKSQVFESINQIYKSCVRDYSAVK